jgi:hypothetical protein
MTLETLKHPAVDDPSGYTDTEGLAVGTRTSKSLWEKRRVRGGDETPPFIVVGAKVLYRWADVHDWLAKRKFRSTSEAGSQRPAPRKSASEPAHAGA